MSNSISIFDISRSVENTNPYILFCQSPYEKQIKERMDIITSLTSYNGSSSIRDNIIILDWNQSFDDFHSVDLWSKFTTKPSDFSLNEIYSRDEFWRTNQKNIQDLWSLASDWETALIQIYSDIQKSIDRGVQHHVNSNSKENTVLSPIVYNKSGTIRKKIGRKPLNEGFSKRKDVVLKWIFRKIRSCIRSDFMENIRCKLSKLL